MKIMKSYILVVALLLPSISFTQCLTTTPTYRSRPLNRLGRLPEIGFRNHHMH